MEEVPLPPKDKEEDLGPDANVIEVRTETGAYTLARIERSFPDEQSAPADMVLVQACSANEIDAPRMGLKRAGEGGVPYKMTDWIPFGTIVHLYSTKGEPADAAAAAADTKNVWIEVIHNGVVSKCRVEDVNDTPLIQLLACEHFGLPPDKFKVTRIGSMFALEERTIIEMPDSNSKPIYVQVATSENGDYKETRIPYTGDCTRTAIFYRVCSQLGLDVSKYAVLLNGSQRVTAGDRLILQTQAYADRREQEMLQDEQLAKEEYHAAAKRTREEREGGACFVIIPGEPGHKRLALGRDAIMVNSIRRAACNKYGFNADEYEFESDYGFDYARNGMTYVLIKKK